MEEMTRARHRAKGQGEPISANGLRRNATSNLNETAQILGLTIPLAVPFHADEVIP
jgi:hypothetical protein